MKAMEKSRRKTSRHQRREGGKKGFKGAMKEKES